MKQLVIAERVCLIGHIVSMVFGLVGILLVVPHAEIILNLAEVGQTAMQWSMAGGGVVYMILGAAAVSLYAYRTLGLGLWLSFLLPSVLISLSSELLGTSTGFPFGHYSYLSGLGYKIGGLVPFTIPLSWFYVGFVSYLLARAGLEVDKKPSLWRHLGAIALGALLLTSWDFVLDPAMSQTSLPFWYWQKPGAFFWYALSKLCWMDWYWFSVYDGGCIIVAKYTDKIRAIATQFTFNCLSQQLCLCYSHEFSGWFFHTSLIRLIPGCNTGCRFMVEDSEYIYRTCSRICYQQRANSSGKSCS